MNYRNENLISDLSKRIDSKLKLEPTEKFYIRNTVERFFNSKWIKFLPTIYGKTELSPSDKQEYQDFVFGCKHSAYIKYSGTRSFPPASWLYTRISNNMTIDKLIETIVKMIMSHPSLPNWWKQFHQNNELARQWYEMKHKT